jgi:hypothetical protein
MKRSRNTEEHIIGGLKLVPEKQYGQLISPPFPQIQATQCVGVK